MQRDLLPIVEGSTVTTKYGPVKTDHVLFIAAGAFHVSEAVRPDPRAAGPLPDPRRARRRSADDDFVRILTEPKNALTQQYAALLATEGVTIEFTDDAVDEIARIAAEVNRARENIGARRLHTCSSALLDDLPSTRPTSARRPSRSRPPTCASASTPSSRTRTSRSTFSERGSPRLPREAPYRLLRR